MKDANKTELDLFFMNKKKGIKKNFEIQLWLKDLSI